MEKKMNKTEFIHTLAKKINYSIEDCAKINEILEHNFFLSRKNRSKIIHEFINTFHISSTEADLIYNSCMEIIMKEIKNKVKHPFKNREENDKTD